jgi:hypothetical protein
VCQQSFFKLQSLVAEKIEFKLGRYILDHSVDTINNLTITIFIYFESHKITYILIKDIVFFSAESRGIR